MIKEVILHNIRSAHNVGSILRTCDAAGVTKIYLCGYTPTPTDRFGRKRKDIAKASLGAEDSVDWEKREDTVSLIEEKTAAGVAVIAVEQTEDSIDYKLYDPTGNVVYVFGNEVEGISPDILRECKKIIEIQMSGAKESLNVSVAVGIILYAGRQA